jgi:porin
MNAAPAPQSNQPSQVKPLAAVKQEPDELRQQLDIDAAALSKIPADPLIQPDPFAPIFRPVDKLTDRLAPSARLKFGATYTFLN